MRVLRISNGLMSLSSGLLLDWTGARTWVTEESIKFFMLKTVLERALPPEGDATLKRLQNHGHELLIRFIFVLIQQLATVCVRYLS